MKWDNNYLENPYPHEWVLTKSPGGAHQWTPKVASAAGAVPYTHDPSKKHALMMFTTDLALKVDPACAEISKRFLDNPQEFADGRRRPPFLAVEAVERFLLLRR